MNYNFKEINVWFRIILLIGFSFSLFYGYINNDWQSLLLAGTSPLIIFMPYILKLVKINISEHYVFLIYLVAFFALFIGETLRVYIITYWYDKLIHMLTGILLFLMGITIIYQKRSFEYIKKNWRKSIFVAIFFCCLVAFVWEGFEYSQDLNNGTQMMQDGGRDTLLDLLNMSLGASIGLLIVTRHFKYKEFKLLKIYFEEPILR